MLFVLGLASAAIALWAWWLVKTRRAGRGLLAIAFGVPAVTTVFGWLTVHRLRAAFDASANANPAERSHVLSSEIAGALAMLVVPITAALVAAAVLVYLTLRRSQRSS